MERTGDGDVDDDDETSMAALQRLQPLMRYHSAPGSFLSSLIMESPASSSPVTQQVHHPTTGSKNMKTNLPISSNTTANEQEHITLKIQQQVQVAQQQQQQQQISFNEMVSSSSSSMNSVGLTRMGSQQFDVSSYPNMTFRGQQHQILDTTRDIPFDLTTAAAAYHHHPQHHHHHHPHHGLELGNTFSHEQVHHLNHHHHPVVAAGLNPGMIHDKDILNPVAFSSSPQLKQETSPADLLSKLVEGITSSSPRTNSSTELTHPPSQATLLRSPSDISSSLAADNGGPNAGNAGMWDNHPGFIHDMVPNSRKRLRDSSSEHQHQQQEYAAAAAEEMAYCDEEQCNLEHPAALILSRHLSLRSDLQDSVPCKLRARRGCATHPRSVAERVRRTKISEGIKKLHDLVPNMDKQTNTADMLNHATEYMKHLQEQNEQLKDENRKLKEELASFK